MNTSTAKVLRSSPAQSTGGVLSFLRTCLAPASGATLASSAPTWGRVTLLSSAPAWGNDRLRFIPVALDITSLQKDMGRAQAGVIRFLPPRACRLSLSYSGEDNNQYILTMSEPNGGLCARLTNAQLRLECVGPTELKARYEYKDASNAIRVEEIKLGKAKQASVPKTKRP